MKLSEKVKTLLFAGMLAVAGVGMAVAPAYAGPDAGGAVGDISSPSTSGGTASSQIDRGITATGVKGSTTAQPKDLAKKVVGWMLWAVGIASVIVVIIGGILYTTSGGDQAKVTKAKNTILYGLVGLAVALLAYAIVNFVITTVAGQ